MDRITVAIDTARALATEWAQAEGDDGAFPVECFARVKDARLAAAPLADGLGGIGCALGDAVRLTEATARVSPSLALLLTMPLGLAGVHAIDPARVPDEHQPAWRKAVDELAARYRDGAWYAACNSEKGAGGSLDATKTVASRSGDGVFVLTGEKILASGGRYADYFFSTAKIAQEHLPGAGVVEFFFVPVQARGVDVLSDWDGFGMRSTESQTVRYTDARSVGMIGFPNFIGSVAPLQYWYCLFAAIPLGCAAAMLAQLATPAPQSAALRLRFADAQMRVESLRAYLSETASMWRAAAGAAYAARVLRTKTYVTQESTKLCAELFALSGGRHYRRTDPIARLLCDSFAGTALRPPLPLALDMLVEQFPAAEG
jgi:alkylation response protein AidB-like acyl-CoA dehydrogenase